MSASFGLQIRPAKKAKPQEFDGQYRAGNLHCPKVMTSSSRKILTLGFAVYAISTLISMAVMSIGAAALLVALLVAFGGPAGLWKAMALEATRPWMRWYLRASVILFGACVLSLMGGIFFPLIYNGKGPEIHFLADLGKGWYFLWPWILATGLNAIEEEDRRKILNSWLGAFSMLGVFGIIQYFVGWPKYQSIPETSRFHAVLFLGHHLSVASILIFPFFVALDRLRSRFSVFWAASVAAGLIMLFLTYSRMLWIALPVGIFFWAIWRLPRRWALTSIAAVILGGLLMTQVPIIHRRIENGAGISDRKALWLANIEFLKARPLTGTGWRHNIEVSGNYLLEKTHAESVFSGHAHNNLIDMLGGTGLIGAFAWIFWCVVVMAIAWKSAGLERTGVAGYARGLFCAWIVFHLNGMTQVNFWEGKVQHQISWAIALSLSLITSQLGSEKTEARSL
jgi:O-antigen ligase